MLGADGGISGHGGVSMVNGAEMVAAPGEAGRCWRGVHCWSSGCHWVNCSEDRPVICCKILPGSAGEIIVVVVGSCVDLSL